MDARPSKCRRPQPQFTDALQAAGECGETGEFQSDHGWARRVERFAHDVRSPLAVVHECAVLLEESYTLAQPNDHRRVLEYLHGAAHEIERHVSVLSGAALDELSSAC